MKVRVRFTKTGEMKYIGHLDIMRCFQKAIRRAGFDIAYSQGFNPHQILSFASPLSLGMESEGEYFDAEFNSCLSSEKMIKKFNKQLNDDIRVISFRVLPENAKTNAMASLRACKYCVSLSDEVFKALCEKGKPENLWWDFLSQPEITTERKTKSKLLKADIKPLIIGGKLIDNAIELMLCAGSEKSLKPISVINAFFESLSFLYSGEEAFLKGLISITRLDQFTVDKDSYLSLGEVGEIYE